MDAWGVAASSGSTNQSRECREERALRSENALCGREPVRSRVHGVWTMTEDTTSGEQVWAEQEGGVRGHHKRGTGMGRTRGWSQRLHVECGYESAKRGRASLLSLPPLLPSLCAGTHPIRAATGAHVTCTTRRCRRLTLCTAACRCRTLTMRRP